VIDNDYSIWRAFKNQYWPALYFIDAQGRVREHHFGEGEYERSEQIIQRLLGEANVGSVPGGVVSVEAAGVEVAADWDNLKSPENYVGHERTQNFVSPGGALADRRRVYAAPAALGLTLGGIPGVLMAVWLVKSLPLDIVRWGVIVVVLYTALTLIRSAAEERRTVAASVPAGA